MKRLLIDTHVWLWWLHEPERLGKNAARRISQSGTTILLSAASAWEITIKYQVGKLKLPQSPDLYIPKQLAKDRFSSLEIHTLHALHTFCVPLLHRDPFDRILIAQSQVEKIPLMTSDPLFKQYDLELIWAED